jgi:glutamate/tyrosine decarboxylase-like PLP-dependent enzyme
VTVEELLQEFTRDVARYPFGNGHPRFFGWVNSPPAPIAILSEVLAAAMNPSVAGGNHAAVYVERAVVNWFKAIVGFPSTAMGLLVSGGSMAAVTALAVARHTAAARAGWSVREAGVQGAPTRLVVYKGSEGHSCHQKAIELLGIGSANLRTVPKDAALRIVPEELDRLITEDEAAGYTPMAVIASAGTVNTGAIDPIGALARVCRKHRVWLHVDGAYGAPAILSAAYHETLADIAQADSIAVDPHKWLYVPVEAGLVLVKDASAMRDSFSLVPPYLRTDGNEQGVQGPPWFSEYGIQQTRGFRALKVWMALKYFGLDGYRALIDHDLALARYLADRVRALPSFAIREPTSLGIVCFRYAPPNYDEETLTRVNTATAAAIQLGGEAFLSSTVIDGRFWLRACIVNPLASEQDIDRLVAAVVSTADAVVAGRP